MQYALVSSTCKTTRRNMTLAVEPDVKQQINLNLNKSNQGGRYYQICLVVSCIENVKSKL